LWLYGAMETDLSYIILPRIATWRNVKSTALEEAVLGEKMGLMR